MEDIEEWLYAMNPLLAGTMRLVVLDMLNMLQMLENVNNFTMLQV